jgi:hypothetical protein
MKLGFIILAHNDPDAIRHLVAILATAGNQIVIHFDASSPAEQREAVCKLESESQARARDFKDPLQMG